MVGSRTGPRASSVTARWRPNAWRVWALGCEVLFVSASEERRLDHILDVVAGRGILTVGETDDFIERGMIRFVLVQNRVRLHVNLAAAQEAGLTISSRLLSLADVVRR